MSRRAWLQAGALLGLMALTLGWHSRDAGFVGWPTLALATATFTVCGRRMRWMVAPVVAVVAGLAATSGYQLPLLPCMTGSVVIAAAAMGIWHLLTDGGRETLSLTSGGKLTRFLVIAVVIAVPASLMLGIVAPLVMGWRQTASAVPTSVISMISGLCVVMPLFIRPAHRMSVGRLEAWSQRAFLLAALVTVFAPEHSIVPAFMVLPLLGWAAARLSMREVCWQLGLSTTTAYVLTRLGHSELSHPSHDPALAPLALQLFILAAALATLPVVLVMDDWLGATARARRAATTVQRIIESASGTALMALDPQLRFTHFNSGARDLTGYTEEEMVGSGPERLFDPGELERQARLLEVPADLLAVVGEMITTERRTQWILRHKHGHQAVMSLTMRELVDDQTGERVGYIAAGEDITEQERTTSLMRAALARERAAVRRLREADRVKQELVSTVSHELRTPVTSIAGYTELLADGSAGDLQQEQRTLLERIDRNAERLRALIEDLLALSRAESGEVTHDPQPMDLRDPVREAFTAVERTRSGRDLLLRADLPRTPVRVLGEPSSLERVVINLLTNAIKFTPDGGRILTALSREGGTAVLQVQDTGVGISQADQERLFDRFFRASAAVEHATPGTGLGLSIVRHIVEQHGGRVEVESELGVGTTFVVRLPMLVDQSSSSS